jgi:hypothetical protein
MAVVDGFDYTNQTLGSVLFFARVLTDFCNAFQSLTSYARYLSKGSKHGRRAGTSLPAACESTDGSFKLLETGPRAKNTADHDDAHGPSGIGEVRSHRDTDCYLDDGRRDEGLGEVGEVRRKGSGTAQGISVDGDQARPRDVMVSAVEMWTHCIKKLPPRGYRRVVRRKLCTPWTCVTTRPRRRWRRMLSGFRPRSGSPIGRFRVLLNRKGSSLHADHPL